MLSPWFVTGFSNGEAAFTYSRNSNSRGLRLFFSIKLRFDEKCILDDILDFFNVGKIYAGKAISPGKFSGKTAPSFLYLVCKMDELKRVVDHFDKYPLIGKKLKAYSIWRNMYIEKLLFKKPDVEILNGLANKLSSLTTKNTLLKNKLYGKSNINL